MDRRSNEAARRLAHVEELFAAAKALPAAERAALLSLRCAGDAALLREVLLLLEQDARDGTLLDATAERRLAGVVDHWRRARDTGAGAGDEGERQHA